MRNKGSQLQIVRLTTRLLFQKQTNGFFIASATRTNNQNSFGGTPFQSPASTFGGALVNLRRAPYHHHTTFAGGGNGIINDRDQACIPNNALKDHFDAVMIRNRARLFDDYESYKRSLPVRKTGFKGKPWKLVDLPYFAREEDLRCMAKQLESIHPEKRCTPVKYVVSPTCTGKTASICPAFLNSAAGRSKTKYSHYLYLAFANNPGWNFHVDNTKDISECAELAEAQGEAFMFECLQSLFDLELDEFGCSLRIPTDQDLRDQGGLDISRTEEWAQLFDANVEPGRILIHVDEHRRMSENPHFRRGALSAIGGNLGFERASVVATYTEVPAELPGLQSSRASCRYAVPVPALAVNAALRYARCPDIPEDLDSSDWRFLASFKFRLAAHLCSKMTLFHAYTCPDIAASRMVTNDIETLFGVYRRCIENAKNSMKATGPYRELVKILSNQEDGPESFMRLTQKPHEMEEEIDRVIDLFLGVSESEFDEMQENKRVKGHLVSFAYESEPLITQPWLTLSLRELLSKKPLPSDKGAAVYRNARKMFLETLMTPKVEDLLSGCPLERAYLWALSTRAARKDFIPLGNLKELPFKCQHVTNGRIFKNANAFDGGALDWSLTDIGWMEPGTIYYAQERADDGEASHPLCDIFFLTDENDLVLLDITGSGNQRGAETQKKKKLSKYFIDAWRRDGPAGQGLVVAILCPIGEGVTRASKDYPELKYIYGRDAREMLGGLAQFLAWY